MSIIPKIFAFDGFIFGGFEFGKLDAQIIENKTHAKIKDTWHGPENHFEFITTKGTTHSFFIELS